MRKDNLKFKIAIAINALIFVLGGLTNLLFLSIAIGYITSITLVYYLGAKISDAALNVGYIWLSKWTLFIIFLLVTGTNTPDTFLHAMTMFVVFNITVNPAIFILKQEASQ